MTEQTMQPKNVENPQDLMEQRREKLDKLRESGSAFPNGFERENLAADLAEKYADSDKETLAETKIPVKIAGRMMTRRLMGKASFFNIQDMSGVIQVYARKNDLPEGAYDAFKEMDLGDILAIEGFLFRTKTGELSVHAESLQLLTKSLHPLPDKWAGLSDQETCYRQRYIDLIANEETRKRFKVRSQIISLIRDCLTREGFLEVETPMMHAIPGGAIAKPFATHHNALDMPLFLRVAPELNLKRLVVGGFEQVFEINRNFRNEGLSTQHNPEFTMLEFYWAYKTYLDLMDFTEKMLREVTEKVLGSLTFEYQGKAFDLSKPFARHTVLESVCAYNPDIKMEQLTTLEAATALAKKLEIPLEPHYGLGKIQIEIFEKTTEDRLIEPTFITEYPAEVSPLARRSDTDPHVTDRFEFFMAGREIANGFSELNDPDDQKARFLDQVKQKDAGDDEAMHFDADYITALEYGLPPTAGEGIGIDRLVMMLTDAASIRDVLLFPHMRHK